MKYRVIKLAPEYKALIFSLTVLQFGLLGALYLSHVSVSFYFYAYVVVAFAGLVVNHYRVNIMEDGEVLRP